MMRTARLIKFLLLISLSTSIMFGLMGLEGQSAQAAEVFRTYFPVFFHHRQPLAATSYYVSTFDPGFHFNLGKALGTTHQEANEPQDSVVVLNFSYPICFDNGNFGADLYSNPENVRIEQITNAVKHFALGYYHNLGSDHESNLVIGVGTNNKSEVTPSNTPLSDFTCDGQGLATAHGKAWGTMISALNHWAFNDGIFHQVQFYGASNMELGWNTPAWTRAWIAGFEQGGSNFLLNFGDASGCPYEGHTHWSCGTKAFREWTEEDVWFISYGSPSALPLPLIYLTNGVHAKQWASLSQYSVREHGFRMDFTGVFTQWQYCQQFSWCNNTDNTPEEAYLQLYTELGRNAATAQELRWKADIRWILQSEWSGLTAFTQSGIQTVTDHPVSREIKTLQSALETATLSPLMDQSLTGKLSRYETMATNIATARANPAIKDPTIHALLSSSRDRSPGVLWMVDGTYPDFPFGALINNSWVYQTEAGHILIGAGAPPENPAQGVLYVLQTEVDGSVIHSSHILAPAESGPLTIEDQDTGKLLIRSENGDQFYFDLENLAVLDVLP